MTARSYNRELSDDICRLLASGKTVSAICRMPGMPSDETVRRWVLDNVDGFTARYRQARTLGYEVWADDIVDLPNAVTDLLGVNKARLQVDSRKWILSKALPKMYGERVTVAGDPDAPLAAPQQPGPSIEDMLAIAAAKVSK